MSRIYCNTGSWQPWKEEANTSAQNNSFVNACYSEEKGVYAPILCLHCTVVEKFYSSPRFSWSKSHIRQVKICTRLLGVYTRSYEHTIKAVLLKSGFALNYAIGYQYHSHQKMNILFIVIQIQAFRPTCISNYFTRYIVIYHRCLNFLTFASFYTWPIE